MYFSSSMVLGVSLAVYTKLVLFVWIASILKKYIRAEKMLILVYWCLCLPCGTQLSIGGKKQWPSIHSLCQLWWPLVLIAWLVLIIFCSSLISAVASTLNPFATGIASATARVGSGDSVSYFLWSWVTLTALSTWFFYRYADKILKKITKSHWFSTRAKKIWNTLT